MNYPVRNHVIDVYTRMVVEAIAALNRRRGSSRRSILHYIKKNYEHAHNDENVKDNLNIGLFHALSNECIIINIGPGHIHKYMLSRISRQH